MVESHAIACQIPQGKCRLTLDLETRAIHQLHEALDKLGFILRKLLPVINFGKNETMLISLIKLNALSTAMLLSAVVQ